MPMRRARVKEVRRPRRERVKRAKGEVVGG